MTRLYGDGIHDDTEAIQALIDGGACEVTLPPPERYYLISKPLELPSHFRLVLPRYAEIRLADRSDCVMVKNKMRRGYAKRLSPDTYENELTSYLWSYVDDFLVDEDCSQIELCGGIWNCNNQGQLPNPERKIDLSVREFYGCGMLFYGIRNFKLSDLTVKDPSQYGVLLDTVSYFTVENVTFDYNKGNPYPINMDGIHLSGNCHFGVIRNLRGTCYDDMVALNAHEGSRGDITNIEISGLYAAYCHSAVRLLLVGERVENIHISGIFGSFYQYCVGLTKYYPGENTGYFDAITVEDCYVSKALPAKKGDFMHPRRIEDALPLFWVQEDTVVKSLLIRNVQRRETVLAKDTVQIGANATVERLTLRDIKTENTTGEPMPLLNNYGTVGELIVSDADCGADEWLSDHGRILKIKDR